MNNYITEEEAKALCRAKKEKRRREVWLAAWNTVAGRLDAKERSVATKWADLCLEDYEEQFNDHLVILSPKEREGT